MEEKERPLKTRDVADQHPSHEVTNGDEGSHRVKPRKKSAERHEERTTNYVAKSTGMTNGREISDDDDDEDADLFEDDGVFSEKYYQLEKEIQELLTEKFGEGAGPRGGRY